MKAKCIEGLVFASMWCLACCGCSRATAVVAPIPVAVPQVPPTTLTGNWRITGVRSPASLPLLSTTLVVSGTQITGQGDVQIQCSPEASLGGSVDLAGQIADDGSFQAMFSVPSGVPAVYQVTVSGSSPPAASPGLWAGTYALTASIAPAHGDTGCAYSHSGAFTATPIAALTGTYSGPATNGLLQTGGYGTGATYSLQVAQSAPSLVMRGSGSMYQLALTGTISVSGSPCFTSGTTTGAPLPSSIGGDTFYLLFAMNNGSSLALVGHLGDDAGSSLVLTSLVSGGICDHDSALSTLTRS